MAPARYIWIFAVFAVCFANHVKARSAVIGNESLPLAARAKRCAVVRGSFTAWFFGDEPEIGESPREIGAESGAAERVSRCKGQDPGGETACSSAYSRETSFIDASSKPSDRLVSLDKFKTPSQERSHGQILRKESVASLASENYQIRQEHATIVAWISSQPYTPSELF